MDGATTHRRILDVALAGFARDGYAATSIREIARGVGVRESAIYARLAHRHIEHRGGGVDEKGGKDRLLALEVAERDAPPDLVLPQIVRALLTAWEKDEARRFLSFLLREGGPASPVVADTFWASVAETRARLGALFQRWMREGAIRADFPAEHLAWEFIAPVVTLRLDHLHAGADDEDRKQARRRARTHVRWFLECTRPGTSRRT
ncbi:TetR/AcrR family transcriptional regulator [Tenggerimyces flavus]|uniref:TetR/AcrR family transcriptional regulator n=1 Tax=Tenggerimyces flavus TaxID=1708749 RepID=A0ABV7YJC3_9ACTN|nr:TetR/AcrR family transcriptional regulator [Tenggerimyces flavus]MBM7790030.1 AcrR family transcriptional regulator [Tenggerimyces flavus]